VKITSSPALGLLLSASKSNSVCEVIGATTMFLHALFLPAQVSTVKHTLYVLLLKEM
jgi:hypothetical protein